MRILLVLALVVSSAVAGHIKLKKCDSGNLPLYVDIPGCDSSGCKVKNHSYLQIFAAAKFPLAAKSLRVYGTIKWWFITKNFEYSGNACNEIDIRCPVKAGEVVKVKVGINADAPFSMTPTVTLNLVNEKDNLIFCAKTDITIS